MPKPPPVTPLPEVDKHLEPESEPGKEEFWLSLLKSSFRIERELIQLDRLRYRDSARTLDNPNPTLWLSKVLLGYIVKMLREEAGQKAKATRPTSPPEAQQDLGAAR